MKIDEEKDSYVRKLEVEYAGTHLRSYEEIGRLVAKCLTEAKENGFYITKLSISVGMPFFHVEGAWKDD